MGKLNSFHFLGVNFEVAQTLLGKNQGTAEMHPRSCSRALGKVIAMKENAVHAARIQRYLIRWSNWWHSAGNWTSLSLLYRWMVFATIYAKEYAWLGRGLVAFERACYYTHFCGVSTTVQCQQS